MERRKKKKNGINKEIYKPFTSMQRLHFDPRVLTL